MPRLLVTGHRLASHSTAFPCNYLCQVAIRLCDTTRATSFTAPCIPKRRHSLPRWGPLNAFLRLLATAIHSTVATEVVDSPSVRSLRRECASTLPSARISKIRSFSHWPTGHWCHDAHFKIYGIPTKNLLAITPDGCRFGSALPHRRWVQGGSWLLQARRSLLQRLDRWREPALGRSVG